MTSEVNRRYCGGGDSRREYDREPIDGTDAIDQPIKKRTPKAKAFGVLLSIIWGDSLVEEVPIQTQSAPRLSAPATVEKSKMVEN